MGAVCAGPLVDEVMLAETDAASLYNELCCAAGLYRSIYSQLYKLSNACHQDRLVHIHTGLSDLAQRRSAALVVVSIKIYIKKRKTLLVLRTNMLLLPMSLELLCGPIYLYCTGTVFF